MSTIRSENRPENWVSFYTISVSILGALSLVASLFSLPHDLVGMGVFAILAVIAELGNVELFHTTRGSSVSVAMIVSTGAILALGPWAGMQLQVLIAIVNTAKSLYENRKSAANGRTSWLRRSAFNVGMFVISSGTAGLVFALTGGESGNLLHAANFVRIPLVAAADTIINLALLLIVISLQSGERVVTIWKQDFAWSMPISIGGGMIGGAALALAYQITGLLGVSVFFLPIFFIGYAFRLYLNNLRSYVDQLERQKDELHEANIELLETLSAVIDAYDIFTFGHSAQVAEYARALSEEMELPQVERELIFKAALVHDLGKVGVPDKITGKLGALTSQEYEILKRHPEIGAEILGRMKGFKDLVPLVRSHQEKWDGTGYPDGLSGEEIPLGARVITLADSLDAMLSDRTYRRRIELSQVVEEVQRCSGRHFDPRVVLAFLNLVKQKDPGYFHNSAVTVEKTVRALTNEPAMESVQRFLKRSLVEAGRN